MKVRVSKNQIVEIHKRAEKVVLRTGLVRCWYVNCLDNDSLDCSECCFGGMNKDSWTIEYSKIKVDEE